MEHNDPSFDPRPQAPATEGLAGEVGQGDVPEAGEARLSRRAAWLAMGAVALALGLIWMAPGLGEPPTVTNADGETEYPGDPDDATSTGKAAPLHFTLKDTNGADVQLAAFKGKVILLNFWATWCGPCKAEIPSLVELQKKYRDDLVVLGFSVDDPVDKMRLYAKEYSVNYPLLVGEGREDVQEAFGPLYGIPVSVIIDREGRIAKKHSGIASKSQFEREIKSLL